MKIRGGGDHGAAMAGDCDGGSRKHRLSCGGTEHRLQQGLHAEHEQGKCGQPQEGRRWPNGAQRLRVMVPPGASLDRGGHWSEHGGPLVDQIWPNRGGQQSRACFGASAVGVGAAASGRRWCLQVGGVLCGKESGSGLVAPATLDSERAWAERARQRRGEAGEAYAGSVKSREKLYIEQLLLGVA